MAEALSAEAQSAIENEESLKALVNDLSGSSRLARQRSASVLCEIAQSNIELIAPFSKELVDALNRPEASTRWECLDSLTKLVDYESRLCDRALSGAEASLFDEDNGQVRLSAMKFLCRYGATTPMRSEKVWSLIDEGIQCYHGDVEFNDMLAALVDFSQGKLSKEVKKAFADRMDFDAHNARGTLRNRAEQIIANLK